jgi:hypothetical protein
MSQGLTLTLMNEDVIDFIEVAALFTGDVQVDAGDRGGGMVEQEGQLDE